MIWVVALIVAAVVVGEFAVGKKKITLASLVFDVATWIVMFIAFLYSGGFILYAVRFIINLILEVL